MAWEMLLMVLVPVHVVVMVLVMLLDRLVVDLHMSGRSKAELLRIYKMYHPIHNIIVMYL